ncbi:MAG TPA: alpha-amylase family glycosyl hydrolase [Nitrospiria bacterium]|jgi:glycosidase
MKELPTFPALYEINTRVWLRQFDSPGQRATLEKVPSEYWDRLSHMGIHIIWLMGVWETNQSSIEKYGSHPSVIEGYRKALPDFKKADVIGSPYAIDDYRLNPALGNLDGLKKIREDLNQKGMLLFLDFIPNHFNADSHLIQEHPEFFIQGNKSLYQKSALTFFKHKGTNSFFAHGRDPYFPPWIDTVQVNYFHPDTRRFMIQKLVELAEISDGVRCDMAMLVLNSIFKETWNHVLDEMGYKDPQEEFWDQAIKAVKSKFPGFIFMGEVYWGKEGTLQEMGFDFTYDKSLTDFMENGNANQIRKHLETTKPVQPRSVHFIENHDEERAVRKFGKEKSLVGAVTISTLPGLRFFHDGQFEGKMIKLPVQLGREPKETVQEDIQSFYHRLLSITKNPVFTSGEWTLLESLSAGEGDGSHQNILIWIWGYQQEKRLVTVNFSNHVCRCRVFLNFKENHGDLTFSDLLNHQTYTRKADDLQKNGLFIELERYQSHIFSF